MRTTTRAIPSKPAAAVSRVSPNDQAIQDMSDATLVVALARNYDEALAEAHRRHGPAVAGLARRLCGERAVDDIVQDVFFDLWLAPERFDGDRGSLRNFLLMRAHSRSVDVLRGDTSRRARESVDAHRRAVASAVRAVDDTALAMITGEAVAKTVAALPDAEREAIMLAFFGGHTYREVARLLQQPEGTIKSRIRSGLNRLRDLMLNG